MSNFFTYGLNKTDNRWEVYKWIDGVDIKSQVPEIVKSLSTENRAKHQSSYMNVYGTPGHMSSYQTSRTDLTVVVTTEVIFF